MNVGDFFKKFSGTGRFFLCLVVFKLHFPLPIFDILINNQKLQLFDFVSLHSQLHATTVANLVCNSFIHGHLWHFFVIFYENDNNLFICWNKYNKLYIFGKLKMFSFLTGPFPAMVSLKKIRLWSVSQKPLEL